MLYDISYSYTHDIYHEYGTLKYTKAVSNEYGINLVSCLKEIPVSHTKTQ